MTSAICLWEAPTAEALAAWIDDLVGKVSTNEFFEVNKENAIGLPGWGQAEPCRFTRYPGSSHWYSQ
ncbi:MAG: hypothetical protein HN348_15390 [Proteobacteria bacterium]|nr:hypothetical protein [Pseudomonadota bacterium]